jgi:hypothetical protein
MESIGFTCNFFLLQICTFQNFLYLKNKLRKKFRLSRGVAVRIFDEICMLDISAVVKGYRFQISATPSHLLSWINAPHTQNFEISRANSGVKKIKISFEIFVKMHDSFNFG